MNLAWIAAVLEPRDVVRHPNFTRDRSNSDGPAQLAGMVLGGDWARNSDLTDVDEETRSYLSLVEDTFDADAIATAVSKMAESLAEAPPVDPAASAAFALMLAVAAAEIDDFATMLTVLEGQLRRLPLDGPDAALVRAAVVQQVALRSRDAGLPYAHKLVEVGALLESVIPEACSTFPTSAGVARDSVDTVEAIKVSLLHAASSLWPATSEKAAYPLLDRIELVRQPPSSASVRRAMTSEHEYSRYVEQVFAARDERGVDRFGGPRPADLFHPSLLPELLGSGTSYEARKDLALLRLVREQKSVSTIADTLRLLRQAGAKTELEKQLRRLQAGGPLGALSADARQIIRRRLSPELLRTLEVHVLAAASQILTRAEADAALSAVVRSLDDGGPPPPAGRWELEIVRREVSWAAIAALADASGRPDAAAELLLGEALRISEDAELADRAMRRAVMQLDWDSISKEIKEAWRRWLLQSASDFPGTAEVVGARLGALLDDGVFRDDVDSLVYSVNARLRGAEAPPPIPPAGVAMLRQRLAERADAVAHGRYSFGGVDEADVATALLAVGVGQDLWPELTAFLVNPRVPRAFKSASFDRLASMRPELPEGVAVTFRSRKEALLTAAAMEPFDAGVVPYPAALRFLASYGFLSRAETYAQVAKLAGSDKPLVRREAAETVSVLASSAPADELLALAIPLSHDTDVEVRAQAGKALASFASHEGVLGSVAEQRALELLDADGLRVPLLVVRGLSELGARVPRSIAARVRELASDHPSLAVRRAADVFARERAGWSPPARPPVRPSE